MAHRWNDFVDKVYGCWLGKCICGTIGAPYEGYKGKMDVEFTPELFAEMLPNDDLDLQVLWLDVIERTGPDFTSLDLAKAFYDNYPPSPGEYATFKKNFELGLKPPFTGKFNNVFYHEGMGCPIRSEIWACLAPWNPKMAAALAAKDGCLDHDGESIVAEQYLSAMESMAFNERISIRELIIKSLSFIDNNSKFYAFVGKVIEWCDKYADIDAVFSRVLRDYGHSDCTNMFQNLSIIIAALLLGREDLTTTTMMALNCGFDTDCTCATVGALLGIRLGGNAILTKYSIPDQTYKLGATITRRSYSVKDLADDVAKASVLFSKKNNKYDIKDVPEELPTSIPPKPRFPVKVSFTYSDGKPSIRPGDVKQIKIRLIPVYNMRDGGTVTLTPPEGMTVKPQSQHFRFGLMKPELIFTVSVAKDIPVLMEKNLLKVNVTLKKGDTHDFYFGFVGDQVWRVYGPFWENKTYVAPPKAKESYYAGLGGAVTEDDALTIMRQFHLNMKADWEKEYLEDQLLGDAVLPDRLLQDPKYQGFQAFITGDRFRFEDFMSNSMPCVVYMVRDLFVPEETEACLQIGHSDAFKLWINSDLIAYSDAAEHWTPENVHRKHIALKRGNNRIVLKLARTSGTTDFSIMFTKSGPCTSHFTEFGSSCGV
ncbi:MAG: ADP-ribosylglycohydrolase family protein [Clostridia bacterium]|nr:ADP-ribosylglycohydrolase family protein [Clostridia bacterium]